MQKMGIGCDWDLGLGGSTIQPVKVLRAASWLCIYSPARLLDLPRHIFNGILTSEELELKKKFFPLKRFGQPIDVAHAIIYFLSDASSWVTGADLKIDGGYTLI